MRSDEKAKLVSSVRNRVIATVAPGLAEDTATKLAAVLVEAVLAAGPSYTRAEVEHFIRTGFYNSL